MADGKVTIEASLDTDEFEKELETLRKTATKALEEIEKAAGELSDSLSKLADSGKSFDSLGDSAAEAGTQLETLSDSTDEAEGKVEGLGDQAKSTGNQVDDLGDQANTAETQVDDLGDSSKSTENQIDGMGDTAGDTAADVEDLGDETEDAGEKAQGADDKFSTWQITLGNLASQAITQLIDKIKDLATNVADLGINFTSAMSEVQAISGATDSELEELTATAREYGATTTFSATEAAEALKYMSLAGWDVEESTSALGGVLDLAAASGMDLAEASDMVTDYLSAFGMEASDSAYLADMLAYAQSNANTSVDQLGEAYKNCAANLNAAGQDVETVTSLLEGMANQGYKGSEAGTALAAIMRDITNSMEDGAISIGDTSIAVMDADGNYRDLTDILADVEKATDGMGTAEKAAALSTTFTSDSTKGLNLLLNEGIDSIAGYEEELRNAGGTAEETADTMNDNLGGDLKAMNSAFEELGLKVFDGMEEPLRSAVQFVTDSVIPALEDLIQNFDDIAPVIAAVTAALVAFKAAMAISSLVSGVTTAIQTYQAANEGATIAQALLNTTILANPFALVAVAIAAVVAAIVVLWNTNEDFRNAIIDIWNGICSKVTEFIQGIKDRLSDLGIAFDGTGSVLETLQGVWEGFCNAIAPVFEFAFEQVSTILSTVLDALTGLLDVFIGIFTGDWEQVWTGVQEIFTGVWNGITDAFSNVLDLIAELFPNLETAASDVVNNIVTFFSELPGKISSFFAQIPGAVSGFLDTVITNITTWGSNLIIAMQSAVSGAVSAVGTAFNSVTTAISTSLTSSLSVVASWGTTLSTSLNSSVSGASEAVGTAFSGIKTQISSSLSTALKSVTTWGQNLTTQFKSASTTALNTISTQFAKLPTQISTQLTSAINKVTSFATTLTTKMKSAGTSAVSAIASGLSGLTSKVSTQLSAVTSKVSSWGSSLKSSFTSIGKNVISGMISGINSMVGSLYSSIKKSLSGLVDKAKSALGIHSPSTEMRDEVGVQILPGVGEGIEETTGDLYDTMGDAMNGLVAVAEDTELTPELTATVALEPDTTAIEEKLADLSAAVELHLPDITPYLDQMEAAVELRIAEITARVDARANTGSGVVSALDSEKIDYTALAKAVIQGFIEAGITVNVNERVFGRLVAEYS